jgi:hypothetical protein
LRLFGEHGNQYFQWNYQDDSEQGRLHLIDLGAMTGNLKRAADQTNSYGLTNYDVCIEYSRGIARNLSGAVK